MAENWRIITTRRLCGIDVHDALKTALLLHALCGMPLAMAENPAARLELPAVEVIGTTPLPGIGVPRVRPFQRTISVEWGTTRRVARHRVPLRRGKET